MRKLQTERLKLEETNSSDLGEKNCLHNIKLQGEVTSAGEEAAVNYAEAKDADRTMGEGDYTKQQIFNVCLRKSLLLGEDAM